MPGKPSPDERFSIDVPFEDAMKKLLNVSEPDEDPDTEEDDRGD